MSWVKYLKESMRRDRRRYANLRTVRAVRPNGRRDYVVKACHKDTIVEFTVPTTNPGRTYEPGEILLLGAVRGERKREVLGLPPSGSRNGAYFPPSQIGVNFDTLLVTAASPATLGSGSTGNTVYLIGRGFSEDPLDLVRAVVIDSEGAASSDPLGTVQSVAWVDDPASVGLDVQDGQTVLELSVDVAAEAPDGYGISYEVSR